MHLADQTGGGRFTVLRSSWNCASDDKDLSRVGAWPEADQY